MSGVDAGCQHMTVAQYAKHCGRSDSIIRRYRRNGLVINCEHKQIDVAATDKSLLENLHPLRGGDRTEPPASPTTAAIESTPTATDSAPASPKAESGPFAPNPPQGQSLPDAVRRERLARARLAEIELGEKRGELIIKLDAERTTVTLVRHAIVRMRLMGSRLRGTLAAESDARKVEALIDAEVDAICDDFRKAAALMAAGQTVAAIAADQSAEAQAAA